MRPWPLHADRRKYWIFLRRLFNRNGYSPSFEEIARGMSLKSLATVHKHITNLEKKGLLDRVHNRSRSIDVLPPGSRTRSSLKLPLAGRIAAGMPVEAMETPETISLHDVVGNRDVFALEVRGDSMRDEHIINGDYVLVERTRTARQGEIVVALVHGSETTLSAFIPRAPWCGCSPRTSRWSPSMCPRGRWRSRDAYWACCASTGEAGTKGTREQCRGGPGLDWRIRLACRLCHALGTPDCAFERNDFFCSNRHLRRGGVQPCEELVAHQLRFGNHAARPSHGNLAVMPCLRRSLERTRSTNSTRSIAA